MAENREILNSEEMPRDSYALIELLDRVLPHACVGRNESEIEAHRRAGMRELIDELLNWMYEEKEQDESSDLDVSNYSILKHDGVKRS